MTCRMCGQKIKKGNVGHHLEQSPLESDKCLGCWIFELEFEKFLLRARGRSVWSLKAEELVKNLLTAFDAETIGEPKT